MNQLNAARNVGNLAIPASSPFPTTAPAMALGCVLRELKQSGLTDQSSQRMTEIVVRFSVYIEKGHGLSSVTEIAEEHVEGFVFAAALGANGRRRPSVATMHVRRSALRLYFRLLRQLELSKGDPTLDLVLPARSSMTVRPLTDDEIALCRSFSLHT